MENKPDFTIDFIGIGAAKAASSWIYTCLAEHPEVCVTEPKEINFFTLGNDTRGIKWYKKHFVHCNDEEICGEFSPKYLADEHAAEKIAATFPDAKIIVCLRNPIERFASGIYYRAATGREHELDSREFISNGKHIELERGLYYTQLKRFFDYFPKEQILVLIYDDIEKDPALFMQNVYSFLGVDNTFTPQSVSQRKNITSGKRMRFPFVHKTLQRLDRAVVKGALSPIIVPFLKTLGVHKAARYIKKMNTRPEEKLRPAKEKELYEETLTFLKKYYEDDMTQLESLIGRDLSAWR